jgi:hypothetical protein
VTQYWEDEDQAGIVLDDGTKVSQYFPHNACCEFWLRFLSRYLQM